MMRQRIAIWGLVGILSGTLGGLAGCHEPEQAESGKRDARDIRIGIYDSRSIAVAFAGSEKHEAQIAEAKAALEAARAQDDPEMIAQSEARILEMSDQLHRQGFGTAPVDDILALYPDAVQAVMGRRGLAALVSKWDQAGMRRYAGAEQVDVTAELIEAPDPSERQRRSALEIQTRKPLSDSEVERMIRQDH